MADICVVMESSAVWRGFQYEFLDSSFSLLVMSGNSYYLYVSSTFSQVVHPNAIPGMVGGTFWKLKFGTKLICALEMNEV